MEQVNSIQSSSLILDNFDVAVRIFSPDRQLSTLLCRSVSPQKFQFNSSVCVCVCVCVSVKVCVCVHANWLKGGVAMRVANCEKAHNFQMDSQACKRLSAKVDHEPKNS